MLFWVAKQVILSIILIAVIHYIYVFFKTNLTIPKVKDLIHQPQKQYNEMHHKIKGEDGEKKENMKDELKKYLAEMQEKPDKPEKTDIVGSSFENSFQNSYQTL